MALPLGVTGATGEMGRAVRTEIDRREDVTLAFAISHRHGDRRGLHPDESLDRLLAERSPAAVIDFSIPEASVEYVGACRSAGVPVVVGTTGFSAEDQATLDAAGDDIPVLVAPNFSRGIAALLPIVTEAVSRLPGYDIEITESHHNRKRDAPSGTANRLLEAVAEARDTIEPVYGREGEAPRAPTEVGIHARRAGTITGEHEVLLAGPHEEVRLVHRAEDRGVFAAGAIDAAAWLAEQEPGRYGFSDALANEKHGDEP